MIKKDYLRVLSPPEDEQTLIERADLLSGYTLSELGSNIPIKLQYHKGWVGLLMEKYLGADAGNKSKPDFTRIGVELKTIPVNSDGTPLENTFICGVSLINTIGLTWEQSSVRNKLIRVLWIPIEGSRTIPLSQRRIGSPFLWSPSTEQELYLRRDWEDFMDSITFGEIEDITARNGECLQIKTKSSSSKCFTAAYDKYAHRIRTRPRGFYLKKNFTHLILKSQFFD
ncbi:MAG: DNA mismatch repair endonuclease MutH [Candidatus Dasytiphilus stammeri]